ncbi:FHA domain-containing protein [Spirosoma utsteinense]|uniref:PSer/pThr/pTyr-binding forkhead associated (FHA) protein n=1 Tax=Spirosoma utsteinense TaxID=2585773 RepID=A0ABR6WAX6_9BACT|nr:FHA domain-containing protein [Spirosoma utsteinense]MBC3787339.1 pSer/pThr/pTyr-binding forkhead associated (FHA) protein [Spirosoma utsteinense]MBC3793107.1 pSer/pThr/pTyr-binding forkhead associated (FHA) protein [Spirosoma utsteinense]
MSFSALSAPDDQLDELINRLSQLPTHTIGRRTDNVIVISHGKVSGQHARLILCTPSSFVLEDLDSKNGTFVNGVRITRKVIGQQDHIQLADFTYTVAQLLDLSKESVIKPVTASTNQLPPAALPAQKASLDFTNQFADLQRVFDQYPKLRKNCRNREKMIRTGSVILSSIVGISTALSTGGGALPVLQLMSGAGLSMLVPTLCSTLLSTEEKLEIIDKEYREQYRCPNPACRDPFGTREWELLAQQKTCRRCQAIWVN